MGDILSRPDIISVLRAFSLETYANLPAPFENAIKQAADCLTEDGESEERWAKHYMECHFWQPIADAPVPSRAQLMHGRWSCLLQDKRGTVVGGYAAYIRGRGKGGVDRLDRQRKSPSWDLQWYAGSNPIHGMNRVFKAVYWMPLPAPRKD